MVRRQGGLVLVDRYEDRGTVERTQQCAELTARPGDVVLIREGGWGRR
ncbi:hypothetical protein ABZ137_05390 [Streptomyces bobili]